MESDKRSFLFVCCHLCECLFMCYNEKYLLKYRFVTAFFYKNLKPGMDNSKRLRAKKRFTLCKGCLKKAESTKFWGLWAILKGSAGHIWPAGFMPCILALLYSYDPCKFFSGKYFYSNRREQGKFEQYKLSQNVLMQNAWYTSHWLFGVSCEKKTCNFLSSKPKQFK